MRHRKSFNHLGRKVGHRNSMLSNMAASLILHKRIKTTTAKAKALKIFVEPLITKSKVDSTHSRRIVFSYLQDKNAVSELFREVSPKIADRPGGYTRILKTGTRLGDNAEMCIIELVDYNENLLKVKEDLAKSGRRRRRGSKKKTEEDVTEMTATETTEEIEGTTETTGEKVENTSQEEIIAVDQEVETIVEDDATEIKEESVPEEEEPMEDTAEDSTPEVKDEESNTEEEEKGSNDSENQEEKNEN